MDIRFVCLRVCHNSCNHSVGKKRSADKICLNMDEVDGISAGDRGGVGALNALIYNTKVCFDPPILISSFILPRVMRIPIICIANDEDTMKLKPVVGHAGAPPGEGGGEAGVCEISMACLRGAGHQSSVYRLQAKSKRYRGCGREQRARHHID